MKKDAYENSLVQDKPMMNPYPLFSEQKLPGIFNKILRSQCKANGCKTNKPLL
jgi:hypothetical protein